MLASRPLSVALGRRERCARVQDDSLREGPRTWQGRLILSGLPRETLRLRMPLWILPAVNEAIQ